MKWSPHFILSIFIIKFITTKTRRLEELRFNDLKYMTLAEIRS